MYVEVTQEHIDKGIACDTTECPIALALLDKRGVDQVSVGRATVSVYRGHTARFYELPEEAQSFIHDFDYDDLLEKKLKPFTFRCKCFGQKEI